MRITIGALAVGVLLLGGCTIATPNQATGGMTTFTMKGSLCGAPVDMVVLEGQDRKGFSADCTAPDGSAVHVTSAEANGSTGQQQALTAQTQVIGQLVGLVGALAVPAAKAAKVATGGVAP